MKLKDFFDMYGITVSGAARKIEVSPHHLREIFYGRSKASKRLAKDISQYTQGLVSIEEIMSLYRQDQDVAI